MYKILVTGRFEKDVARCVRRGMDARKLYEAISMLGEDGTLPPRYRMHNLAGKHKGCKECHIEPDWLLVWRQDDKELTLLLVATGTHSDLF